MPSRSIATEAVSWPVTVAAATPPAPIAVDGDQRVGDVDGAEQAAEQVVPADVEGRAEAAGLAADDDDRGQRDRADAETRSSPPASLPVALPSPALIGACSAISPPAQAVSRTAIPYPWRSL